LEAAWEESNSALLDGIDVLFEDYLESCGYLVRVDLIAGGEE
jgi:hypothetical protein